MNILVFPLRRLLNRLNISCSAIGLYLDQLAYFIEVIKCGSISAAAKNLYISQPALSQSIANLEKDLGMKLIKRSYAGIKPTMFGERIYNQAEGIISQLDGALNIWHELSARSLEFSGTAKISCTPDTIDFLSTSITEELQHAYPNVILHVSPNPGMYFQFADFTEKNVSISIGSSLEGLLGHIEKEAAELGLCYEHFSTQAPTILLNKKNTLASKEFVTLEDMNQLKVCVYPEDPPAPFTKYFAGISCQMSTEDAMAGYISANPGSAMLLVLSDTITKLVGKYRNLTSLPIHAAPNIPEFEPIAHFLVHKKTELLTPAEKCVLEVLKYRLNDF